MDADIDTLQSLIEKSLLRLLSTRRGGLLRVRILVVEDEERVAGGAHGLYLSAITQRVVATWRIPGGGSPDMAASPPTARYSG